MRDVVGMREAGVLFPGRLHLIGLEADARPADFEAFADLGQALLHAEPDTNVSPEQARQFVRAVIDGYPAILPQLDAIADTVDHDVIGKLIPKLKAGGVLGSVLGKPKGAEGKDIRVEAFMATPDASLLRQMAGVIDGNEAIGR